MTSRSLKFKKRKVYEKADTTTFCPICVKSKVRIRNRCVKKIELFERSEFLIFSTYKGFELIDLTNRWHVVYQPFHILFALENLKKHEVIYKQWYGYPLLCDKPEFTQLQYQAQVQGHQLS